MSQKSLTQGPVMKTMLLFALPLVLGDLLQQCYNIADTLVVSGPSAPTPWLLWAAPSP